MHDARHLIERRASVLERALGGRLQRQRACLMALETRLRRVHPAAQLGRLRLRVTRAETRLEQAALRLVGARRHALVVKTQRLELLSPTASLERGYAIVRTMGGAVVRRPSEVQPDERLEVRVAEGVVHVRRVAEAE
jgi:exodeoxyribonuclease VII large subunit